MKKGKKMSDKKNKDEKEMGQGKDSEDTRKDLDDILGQLKESDKTPQPEKHGASREESEESPKAENMINKLQELIKHGQLSKALKGLTEGESEVPTAYALRSKFKTRNWVTVQVMVGSTSGDVLHGDLGMVIAWLAGKSKELEIPTTIIDQTL